MSHPLVKRFLRRLTPHVVQAYVWLFTRTTRLVREPAPELEALLQAGTPIIFAMWHRYQIPACLPARQHPTTILVSRSRDGELFAQVARRFGQDFVRASSSRGGAGGLVALQHCLREGRHVSVTPDGPRGPAGSVQPGVIRLARDSGAPIVPFAIEVKRCKILSSWDRFVVPWPVNTAWLMVGEPLYVKPGCDEAEAARELQQRMHNTSRRAAARAGQPYELDAEQHTDG